MSIVNVGSLTPNFPTNIPTCTSTNFSWAGGTPPYEFSLNSAKWKTSPLLTIETPSTHSLSLNLNYPLGTTLDWFFASSDSQIVFGTTSINMTGPTDCYAPPSITDNTHLNGSASNLTFEWDINAAALALNVASCSPINVLWTGGTPPFNLFLATGNTTDEEDGLSWAFPVGEQRNFTTKLPFLTGTSYTVSVWGSGIGQNFGTGVQTVSEGGTIECLLLDSGNVADSLQGVKIGLLISGIAGSLLGFSIIVGLFLLYRRWSKQKRSAKRQILTNVVAGGKYNFSQEISSQREPDISLFPLSAEGKATA